MGDCVFGTDQRAAVLAYYCLGLRFRIPDGVLPFGLEGRLSAFAYKYSDDL